MTHFRLYFLFLGCLLFMYSCQDDDTQDGVLTFTRLSAAPALSRATCSNPPVIPVAVHYQGASGADAACLIDLAKNQIAILNDDFGGTNSDIDKWTNDAASSFPGVSNGEACLKFCLADLDHPSGYGLQEGEPAVTINQTTGDSNNDFTGYLNIFVQFGTGVLGYAPLGGSGNGDGVVIEGTAFGSGSGCGNIVPGAPYDLGRTTTHEVGHYLLLDHIWGGGCSQDDDVADTPDSNDSYYDCPSIGESSCGSTDMHMNYMDYTNDACMYMFSAGQMDRSENYVATSLVILTQNASTKCSGANEEEDGEEDDDDEEEEEKRRMEMMKTRDRLIRIVMLQQWIITQERVLLILNVTSRLSLKILTAVSGNLTGSVWTYTMNV